MNNTINNNVNFTANLNTCTRGSEQKWSKIAKTFAEKTARFPNDDLLVKGSFSDGLELGLNKDNFILTTLKLSKGTSKKLSKLSPESIADKIKTVFNVLKQEQRSIEKAEKFAKDLKLCTNDVPVKTQNKYWQAVNGAITKQKAATLAKDSILKNAI